MIIGNDFLKSQSPKLESDIQSIYELIKSKKLSFCRPTFLSYKRALIDGLKSWPIQENKNLARLMRHGFNSLNSADYWLRLEISATEFLEYNISAGFTRSLFQFYKLHSRQPSLERIGRIKIGQSTISLLDIYIHSLGLGNQFRNALEILRDHPVKTDETKANIAYSVVAFTKNVIEKNVPCKSLEATYALLSKKNTGVYKEGHRVNSVRTSFSALMKVYDPLKYEKETLLIGGLKIDVSNAVKLSPVFKFQLEKLSQSEHMQGKHGHKKQANKSRLQAVLRTIEKLCDYDKVFLKEFQKKGLDCLPEDYFSILRLCSSKIGLPEASELKRYYEIYSGKNISKQQLSKYFLTFHNFSSSQTKSIDISKLLKFGKRFVSDIVDLHKSETKLNGQKNYGIETLHTRFSILLKMAKFINKEATKRHGLHFLSRCDGKYQVELLSKIQAECLNKAISRRTAEGAYACIRWICQVTNQPFINAYRITSNRHAIHAARLGTKDTYSLEEVRELAFYIEKSISQLSVSSKNLLSLHFAKIQIKTCINTASLLTVECDDIRQIDIPTKEKPITVLIQKPRKGYKTDYFNFDPKFPKSAIHDLLYVRDQLTSVVREKFSSNALSKRLFIHEEAGQLKSLTNTNTVPYIAQFLLNAGCTVKYNSAKLRKTGANEIYRQLAKDISRYKEALKHSYPTFVKHYQRISEAKKKLSLQNATEIMDKYFTGKEISSEIKIVTEYSKSTQLTPVGGCASKIGSKEAIAYNKSHTLPDKSSTLRCGDFLACVWCKHYRVVADASHIWQLLSFKRFVLSSMESSVAHFSNNSTQKQAIEALNYRVDSVVNTIESINSSAVYEGKKLMQTKGMHPDWEFALPALEFAP